ncbi:MAG: hypothetical protein A3H45_05640 [Ignavibacteria bacterium RIFCSPLOWO2_02_FULL_55_14]|nr:MAG: hypothetical protein A2X68_11315 [Ignavibacteria bacterium GWC2_56_12]OGU66674.1 MAG: hypothetical protein A3C56_11625 [Ignavibacteria bacterium RIFCSPHIGHO2_02_FULL_56_12]OGU70535.1 MAG: hypothetical protein A3G43_13420 [Ignavibacteria bacterium RIFCSPLOWO2_12_FULL_56_21]OGU71155.1 MAG: hypothetical protein A3H45_05640 [Ignavibacteria bacterium RIFCSPLOWO2_02_FULL_55_14]
MSTATRSSFPCIAIIGVGLIGGSLGLAIRRAFPRTKVVGVDNPAILRKARNAGALTESAKLPEAVRTADLVILAAPSRTILRQLSQVARSVKPDSIVTDVSSVKSGIVRQAEKLFRRGQFIGGHPMAGSERSGVSAADPLLFENALYVLTPGRSVSRARLNALARFLKAIGARVVVLRADVHDRVAAVVSHLPQLTAVALMNVAGKRDRVAARHLAMAAGGFRDMTRIASSPFGMWRDILQDNRKEVRSAMRLMVDEMTRYSAAMAVSAAKLRSSFAGAGKVRSRIPANMKGFLHALSGLQVFLEDKPGSLHRMTGAMARHGISIKDLELVKVREGTEGSFRVWFENRETALKAKKVLRRAGIRTV